MLVRPSLWPANSGLSALDWWLCGARLWSPFSNFRFGIPETGSICDGDRDCIHLDWYDTTELRHISRSMIQRRPGLAAASARHSRKFARENKGTFHVATKVPVHATS
jgi:hypothetical protein